MHTRRLPLTLLTAAIAAATLPAPAAITIDTKIVYDSHTPTAVIPIHFGDSPTRVAVALAAAKILPKDFDAYLFGDDAGDRTKIFEADDETIELSFTGPGEFRIIYAPVDADGKPTDEAALFPNMIYTNYQGAYEWQPLGKGTMIEQMSGRAVRELETDADGKRIAPIYTYEVEIEARKDNPSIYRVKNPFGTAHPNFANHNYYIDNVLSERPGFSTGDDYYLTFDATDPHRVYVPMTIAGLSNQSATYSSTELYGWNAWTCDETDRQKAFEWGKMYDNTIKMPHNSVYTLGLPNNFSGNAPDIELRLPGWVDYTYTAVKNTASASGPFSVDIDAIGADIVSFDCAMVPESLCNDYRFFYEEMFGLIADGATGFEIRNYIPKEGRVSISPRDFTQSSSGRYCLVVLPKDANGKLHKGSVHGTYVKYKKVANWDHVGKATFEDTALSAYFGKTDIYTSQVDIYECPDLSGYYYLSDPYRRFATDNGLDYNEEGVKLFIDATDPNVVKLHNAVLGTSIANLGMDTGVCVPGLTDAWIRLNSVYNMQMYALWTDKIRDDGRYESYAGQKQDNVISFPDGSLKCDSHEGYIKVTINKADGITDIVIDNATDAPTIYYDMHGLRITRPTTPGIYLERRGDKVTKIVVQ